MFISILSISKVYAIVNSYSLLGKTIYIDPGHGGKDSGTTYKDIYEKDINLIMSKKIERYLVSKGATVYLTREKDKDLSTTTVNRKRNDLTNRAKLINKSNPDMYISIHLNYISNSKWQGLQIFYNTQNKENETISNTQTNTNEVSSLTMTEEEFPKVDGATAMLPMVGEITKKVLGYTDTEAQKYLDENTARLEVL